MVSAGDVLGIDRSIPRSTVSGSFNLSAYAMWRWAFDLTSLIGPFSVANSSDIWRMVDGDKLGTCFSSSIPE